MSSIEDQQGKIDSVIDLFNNGKLNKAIEKIDLINLDYPDNPILFNLAGACFFGLGQYENAVTNYKKAISIKPDFPDFHFNLGNSYMELGKLNNAPVAVVVAASTAIVLVVATSESTCSAYPPAARFASIKFDDGI